MTVAFAAIGPPAQAALTFGSNLSAAPATAVCGSACTLAQQSIPPATQAPGGVLISSSGVVVRWRVRTGGSAVDVHSRLRVLNGNTALASGASELLPATAGTYEFPTRISVHPGDRLGIDLLDPPPSGVQVVRIASGGATNGWTAAPLADGETLSPPSTVSGELTINADVEPDVDGDGFGDETQDCAPGAPALTVDCAPPETTITARPKDKSRKKKATFEFSSTEPGSTFECSLDGGPFGPCNSPDVLKVKRARHTFSVRARDEAGNADGSPATDDWKVKKKRKH
jgi:hypothetical protein